MLARAAATVRAGILIANIFIINNRIQGAGLAELLVDRSTLCTSVGVPEEQKKMATTSWNGGESSLEEVDVSE